MDINSADESTVRLLWQNIIQTCLSLAAVGALDVQDTTLLRVQKEVFRRASLLSSTTPTSSLLF